MGLEASILAPLLFGGASGAAQGLLSPSPETAVPFEDIPVGDELLDPVDLLGAGIENVSQLGSDLDQRMRTPITLRGAFAQSPSVMAGGGLPMPIGVTGVDPALADPSLLTSQPFFDLSGGPLDVDRTDPGSTTSTGGGGPTRPPLFSSTSPTARSGSFGPERAFSVNLNRAVDEGRATETGRTARPRRPSTQADSDSLVESANQPIEALQLLLATRTDPFLSPEGAGSGRPR